MAYLHHFRDTFIGTGSRSPIPQRETTADRGTYSRKEPHGRTREENIHGIDMIDTYRRHTHPSFQIFQDMRSHDRPIQLTSRAACREGERVRMLETFRCLWAIRQQNPYCPVHTFTVCLRPPAGYVKSSGDIGEAK